MSATTEVTNRCACSWEISGSEDVAVDASTDHGWRVHNMEATREQVHAALNGQSEPGQVPPG